MLITNVVKFGDRGSLVINYYVSTEILLRLLNKNVCTLSQSLNSASTASNSGTGFKFEFDYLKIKMSMQKSYPVS
jgi:hypothetical protein